MNIPWRFGQPPHSAVLTLRSIVEGGAPVFHVTHAADDHGWRFLGIDTPDEVNAKVVGLGEMLALDPTLEALADLPVGWHAWREHAADTRSRGRDDNAA